MCLLFIFIMYMILFFIPGRWSIRSHPIDKRRRPHTLLLLLSPIPAIRCECWTAARPRRWRWWHHRHRPRQLAFNSSRRPLPKAACRTSLPPSSDRGGRRTAAEGRGAAVGAPRSGVLPSFVRWLLVLCLAAGTRAQLRSLT